MKMSDMSGSIIPIINIYHVSNNVTAESITNYYYLLIVSRTVHVAKKNSPIFTFNFTSYRCWCI